MIFITQAILLVLAVPIAWYQAFLIEEDEHIYHGLWFAAWVILTGGCLWLLQHDLTLPQAGLYCLATGCGHLVVFNIALNRFRGLPWTYTSKTTGSFLDRASFRLFGSRQWILEGILTAIWIAIQLDFIIIQFSL